jgi:serine/threonine protein kinase
LKPENILFTNELTLKIADFGLSASLSGIEGSGLLATTELGDENYLAPEILQYKPY